MTKCDDGDEDELWAELDVARTLNMSTEKQAVDSDDEDEYGNNLLVREANLVDSTLIKLQDGDIHLCDSSCPYAIISKRTGDIVCPFSSMVIGHAATERTDYSTGRNTWSVDPDMNSGTNGRNGMAWRKKIDNVTASKQAHHLSTQFDDSVMPMAKEQQRPVASKVKRGALCVDEKSDADHTVKKARMSKKKVESGDQLLSLIAEASSIFSKLVYVKSPNWLESPPILHNTQPVDTRLLNYEMLFSSALKKYAKETQGVSKLPCIDDIHNISLAVNEIVSNARKRVEEKNMLEAQRFKSIRFREVVSRLAVSLWRGICQTPYMGKARRGGDSFRPFCVGIYYSLKRGLTLSDGTMLVPAFDSFQYVFPSAKEIALNPTSKALHASSHRGLCSIHRCIASIDVDTQHQVFASALRLVPELSLAR